MKRKTKLIKDAISNLRDIKGQCQQRVAGRLFRGIREEIAQAHNEALSYHCFNGGRIDELRYNLWEGNQHLLDRFYGSDASKPTNYKIKIVFFVPDTALWDVYASIYHELLKCDWASVTVIAFKRIDVEPDKSEQEVHDFFRSRKIDAKVEGYADDSHEPISPQDVDLAFYTLGSVAYPEPYKIEFLSLYSRTCYLSYGFLMVEEEDYQFNQNFHHSAWTVFASTNRELELYKKHQKRYSTNVLLSGYPKFDLLDIERNPVEKPVRPVVIWAPHWTIGAVYERLKFGTFDVICESITQTFKNRPDVDFVFKPHPNLLYALKTYPETTKFDYSAYLSDLRNIPNVSVWKHGDYNFLFLQSSAMITDSLSFIAEYLPTGNPLLFLEREDRTHMSTVGEELLSLHYHGHGVESIDEFLVQVIDKRRDPKKESRLSIGRTLLGIGPKPAAETICEYIATKFGVMETQA